MFSDQITMEQESVGVTELEKRTGYSTARRKTKYILETVAEEKTVSCRFLCIISVLMLWLKICLSAHRIASPLQHRVHFGLKYRSMLNMLAAFLTDVLLPNVR